MDHDEDHDLNASDGMAPLPSNPVPHTLLALTIDDLHVPHHLSLVVRRAVEHTSQSCLIVLFSDVFDSPLSHTATWTTVQRLLTFLYVQATGIAQEKNLVLMDVDVLLRGRALPLELPHRDWGCLFRVSGDTTELPLPSSLSNLPAVLLPSGPYEDSTDGISIPLNTSPDPSVYPVVALGGTFDHLHAGHKILLSMAAWITGKKIIVGLTDDALLQKKSNKEVLESFAERSDRVRQFLSMFKPGLIHDIVAINDVYGPTGFDPNIQALVVSKETLSGASAIAKRRAELALPPLRCFVIDVISATNASLDHEDEAALKQAKMSSTFIREWIVQQRQRDSQ